MNEYHKRVDESLPLNSFIFIGDSLTQGLSVSSICNNAANFGLGGDTTTGVLARLPEYTSLKKAKTIILNIGVNDTKKKEAGDILDNYQKILDYLPQNILIVVTAIFPLDGYAEILSKRNKMISEINQSLEKLIVNYQQALFFDITKKMSNEKGNLKRAFHIGDGLHLNKDGYQVWINELKSFFSQHQLLQDKSLPNELSQET